MYLVWGVRIRPERKRMLWREIVSRAHSFSFDQAIIGVYAVGAEILPKNCDLVSQPTGGAYHHARLFEANGHAAR